MNKSMKKILITSLINIVLILICTIMVTFAWLSTNRDVNSSGVQITIDQGDLSFDYTIYQYVYNTNTYTDNGSFTLNQYDMIISSRNIHNAIIIKLEIFGQIIEQHNDFIISLLCTDSSYSTRSLSNVIYFKAGLFNNISSNDAETIYITAENNFTSLIAYKFKTSETTKVTQISVPISNYNNYIINNKLIIYLQIGYDDELAEEFNTITADDLADVIENPTIVFNSDVYELNIATEN